MLELLKLYTSELIAGFAVILSAVSNWRAVKAQRAVERAESSIRRMDLLVEEEMKNAVVGKLALVSVQKLLLVQKHPELVESPESEMERLHNNLALLQEFKANEQHNREIAEAAAGGPSVEPHSEALMNLRRLRIRMEAVLEKETNVYNQLRHQVGALGA